VENELLIRINAESQKFNQALEDVKKKTEDLEGSLEQVALISGAAFAVAVAQIGLATHAYAEAEDSARRLNIALQNQGIYSKELVEAYRAQAEAIEAKTGVDNDAIIKGQALLQTMIGQIEITPELTAGIVDLSTQTGDLNGAFEIIGRAVDGNTRGLKQYGIELDVNLSKQERVEKITEILTQRFGGQAEKMNEGLGSIKGLTTAFDEFEKQIGSRFAPIISAGIQALTSFFEAMKENKPLLDFIVSVTAAVAIVGFLGTGVGIAGLAFLKLQAALAAAEIATSAMSIAVKGLVGATGIGLLVILISEIYLNWGSIWPRMQAIFQAFIENVGQLAAGFGELMRGAFTFNPAAIQEGLAKLKTALTKGYEDATKDLKPIKVPEFEDQDAKRKELADKLQAESDAREKYRLDHLRAENELVALEANKGSQRLIELKKAEVDILAKIEDEKYKNDRQALQARLEELRKVEADAQVQDQEKRRVFQQNLLANNVEFQALSADQKEIFISENQAQLENELQTESTTRAAAAEATLKQQIANQNLFLENQRKFGTAYALINTAMHTEIYNGTKTAFSDLAQLQSSSNSTLKAIGKAAAVANIIIKTAESAMNIYAGFSTIPIIGPILGAAGAAAAVAFGAEQVGHVTAAASGALVEGGRPGQDSVPFLLEPGELVTPRKNFEEVVQGVQLSRAMKEGGLGGEGAAGGAIEVILSLKDDLAEFIETKLVERKRLGLSVQGA
jgi:hypothetical protein